MERVSYFNLINYLYLSFRYNIKSNIPIDNLFDFSQIKDTFVLYQNLWSSHVANQQQSHQLYILVNSDTLEIAADSVKMKFTVSNLPSSMFLLVFFIALVSHTHGSKIDHHRSNKHVPLFIFGDSFLDAGNNNYINTTTLDQANFLPYGETYFKFPTGRFSDGRLISDFIGKIRRDLMILVLLQVKIQFG